jgi:PAS domain S-box-containing protein
MVRIVLIFNPTASLKPIVHHFFKLLNLYMKVTIQRLAVSMGMVACAISSGAEQHGALALSNLPKTSLSLVSIILAVIFPTVLFVLYWNRRLLQKVGEHRKLTAESEERLQFIFEHSPDAVFVVEKTGTLISANSRACKSVKMTKKELLAKSLQNLVPVDAQNEIEENLEQWFFGELQECEGTVLAADGSVFSVEIIGQLLQLENREVLQLHMRDITLRKEAEVRIHAARGMAEDSKELALRAYEVSENASQSKSEFLAGMSREIRTPLNDILGMAGLLSGNNLTSDQKNAIETIQQSSSSLLKTINHVLDIAKMEAGQMEVREEILDLWELCKNLQVRFGPQADSKGLKLVCRCQDTVPLYLVGDAKLLEQVLEELIGNALKFTREGSVSLNIECHSKSISGAGIHIKVRDTGIGIPSENQDSIFEKKIKTGTSENRLFGGLGLAISKQQVELMGGVLGVISSEGKGSTFHFTLSLPQAMDPSSIHAVENSRAKTISRKNTRVLLVEDNKVNQKVGVAILKKIGCHVDAVDNGKYAVQQFRKESYDVVLMDCEMPILDGFETTAQIRAMREPACSVPIIAITANAMKDDEKRCIDAGMDDYISKPVSREVLVKLINKHTAAS